MPRGGKREGSGKKPDPNNRMIRKLYRFSPTERKVIDAAVAKIKKQRADFTEAEFVRGAAIEKAEKILL